MLNAPYELKVRERVDKLFAKMSKKNKNDLEIIYSKLEEICGNPQKFKPLRSPMNNLRRVHVLKSFVITYSVDESTRTVWVEDYAHHDNVYC